MGHISAGNAGKTNSAGALKWFGTALLAVVISLLVYRLFDFAFRVSQDFEVYWRAVRYWLDGTSPYTVRPEDQGFVFKYPPWMIPLLLPVGWMSWSVAKLVWAAVQVSLLFYSAHRLIRLGLSKTAVLLSAFLFWWIWLAHLTAGQITLLLMAAALWAFTREQRDFRLASMVVMFSAKIFSVVCLIGIAPRLLRLKVLLYGLGFLILSHALVIGVYRLHGSSIGVLDLYQWWAAAAASGGAELGEKVVRGQGNHGFTAGVLRLFQVDARSSHMDSLVFLCLSLFFGVLWRRFSRGFPELDRWFGWLALGLIVHPLAWHHSFVLAFPLCALSLHRALERRDRQLIALSLFGMVCIGIFIPQVIGKTLVKPLELVSVKSWGVVVSACSLVLAHRRRS